MCFSISVRTEIHNTLLQYSALTAALSTERAKWRWVTWEVFFIFEESYWKRTPEWLCLAGLCVRGVRCTDLSLHRRAERINSSQRFWNGSKKLSLFFQTIHSFTGHVASHRQTPTSTKKKKKAFFFLQVVYVYLSLSGCLVQLYMYVRTFVDAVWMSNPAKLQPESRSCWMCFLSSPGLSSLGVKKELLCKGNWVLADRSVKYNQRCQSWN